MIGGRKNIAGPTLGGVYDATGQVAQQTPPTGTTMPPPSASPRGMGTAWGEAMNPTHNPYRPQQATAAAPATPIRMEPAYGSPFPTPGLQEQIDAWLNSQSQPTPGDYHQRDLYGLDLQGIGIDKDYARWQMGQLGPLKNIDLGQLGLQREGVTADESTARRTAGERVFDINSDYTSRGAWFTPGKGKAVDSTYAAMNDQLSALDRQRRGIGLDEQGVDLKYQGLHKGLQNQLDKYGINEQQLKKKMAFLVGPKKQFKDWKDLFDLLGSPEGQTPETSVALDALLGGG